MSSAAPAAKVEWQEQKVKGTTPTARSGHTLTLVGRRAYLFGGCGAQNGGKGGGAFNDIYSLDIPEQGPPEWKQLETTGEAPTPRWRHSATAIDDKQLLIFGGLNKGTRHCDVTLFNVETNTWSKIECQGAIPPQRAHHTATLAGRNLVVFGGYGGGGKFFNDVHILELDTWTWQKPNVKGTPPQARSDHAAGYAPSFKKLFIYGGQEGKTYFNDLHVLDLADLANIGWTRIGGDDGYAGSKPLCSHAGEAVESVPDWKFFMFGGRRGAYMEYTNSVSVIDTGTLSMIDPTVLGALPIAREDSAMCYDGRNSRLILFGGWANRWLGDLHYLTVSEIVGPPYAVTAIEPDLGPVTGRTNVVIRGINFFDASKIEVKFSYSGSEVVVPGKFMNDSQISCQTPDFTKFGSHPADVKVSMGGKSYNLQNTTFNYFDETRADKTLAFGTALLESIPAGIPTPFRIQAKDTKNSNRSSGNDVFVVEATCGDVKGDCRVADNNDGTYDCLLILPGVGEWSVNVMYDGKPIRGSPFKVKATESWNKDKLQGSAPLVRNGVMHGLHPKGVVVFGGEECFDVNILNPETMTWSAPRIAGTQFGHRMGNSIALAADRLVIFGGYGLGEVAGDSPLMHDVHFLQPEKDGWAWVTPDVAGTAPHPRACHTAVGHGKRMYVFGGLVPEKTYAEGVAPRMPFNKLPCAIAADLHVLSIEDGNKASWATYEIKGASVPSARYGASGVVCGTKLYLFGGNDGSGYKNEVWILNVENPADPEWEGSLKATGAVPEPRERSFMEVVDGEIYVFGGSVEGANNSRKVFEDLHILNLETNTWRRVYMGSLSRTAQLVGKKVVAWGNVDGANNFNTLESIDPFSFGENLDLQKVMDATATKHMKELDEFVSAMSTGLSIGVSEGNLNALLKVMACVNDVRDRTDTTDLKFDTLFEIVHYLKSKGVEMEKIEKKQEDRRGTWQSVKTKAPQVADMIRPLREREGDKIEHDLKAFGEKVKAFRKEFQKQPFFMYETGSADSYKAMDAQLKEMRKLEKEKASLKVYADVFEFGALIQEPSTLLGECRDDLLMVKQMWDVITMVVSAIEDWKGTLWNDINTEFMDEETKKYQKEMRNLDKKVRIWNAFVGLETLVKNFLTVLPMITDLKHPSMRDRHWKSLMDETKVHFEITDEFKLENLLALQLHNFVDAVGEIVDRAQKEEKMEKSLEKLEDTWSKLVFQFTQHKDTDVHIVKVAEEDFEVLEENQVMVQNMMASKYVAVFQEQTTKWQKCLATVAEVVQILAEIQRTWSYLEDLFIGSDEVRRELPEDAERFVKVDEEVKAVLRDAYGTPNIVETCTKEGLYDHLDKVQKQLELCEKALADYLEAKRTAFPRFYFISKPDLLDILSNGNRPGEIMQHLPKIFQAIKKLELKDEQKDGKEVKVATAMYAPEGEKVPFDQDYALDGKVEVWLHRLISAMKNSLRTTLYKSVVAYNEKPREKWLFDYPAQLVLVASQIWWANEVFAAFEEFMKGKADALKDYNKRQIDQLTELIKLVQGKLERGDRQKVMCLITMDTHARDVIANVVRDGVSTHESFAWQSQLRIRWDEERKDCFINICDAEFRYGYEYLGNGPRLVITPLTDRIYITATQSLHLIMGCAPAGPAGTGKTETTKDLASQLGKAVYVFNCSDQMDYRTMGDIFKGLASSGSWGCFDEFNRLPAEVLSVCSVQFKCILDAIKEKKEVFNFLGTPTNLDPTCGAYITMNPGYLGRTELPESLKALFRPVTVVVPDLELICENMLMAEGYIDAKVLARKFVTLYALLKDLLSKQDHYDWGLRAIKSVLVVAGAFKRAEPTVSEHALLMRALRDFNLPKIYSDDLVVFMGLIGDLFPGVDIPRKRNMEFEEVVRQTCIESHLQPEEDFINRVVQLEELLAIRHCVFTIGPSGCGKTQVYKTLAKAQSKTGKKTSVKDLSPKAITSNELYGYVQLATREWKDGLLSNIMREFANNPDPNPKWIILDGDLDANWIESMNSVMDDNKILTLASNERISLLPNMRLIFEIRDLKFATPATVSRAGILYISESQSQWQSFVASWIQNREEFSDEMREALTEMFEKYVGPTLIFVKKNFKHVLPVLDFNMVQSLCYMLEGMVGNANFPPGQPIDKFAVEVYFSFACVWCFGATLVTDPSNDCRTKFNNWWKDEWKTVRFPTKTKTTVFDFYVDDKTRKFNPWSQLVTKVEFDSRQTSMSSVMVQTQETLCSRYFLDSMVERQHPVLLVGPAGCGKTQLVKDKLRNLNEDTLSTIINFNYFTDSLSLQNALEQPLEKKAGKNYGPPGTKKLIYFVDDLNMPMLDPYMTQSPIELLRQHMDYGHWYDRNKLTLKLVHNCQYVSCMNPTAGSFNINPRLQRHFYIMPIAFPGQESLMTIYQTFLEGHLRPFDDSIQKMAQKVLSGALDLHSKVASTFRKTAINFHYEFNIRHLSNVFQGILMSLPENFKDPMKFSKLWLHESERVYGDLLVSPGDLVSFRKIAKEVCKKYLKEFDPDLLFTEPLVFSHFAGGLAERVYNKVNSFDDLKKILDEALNEYNETNAVMNLVLFEDAMKHVCRISRVITNPSGHALLVGVGGSGKQSLSRLAAHICGYSVFQVTISASYGVNELKEDLRQLYFKTGLKEESVMFLFTDSQITEEKFLVYINDLLSSGEINELWTPEDKENIINSVRGKVKAAGKPDTRENCLEYFHDKVRANLHMVLCFSPVGDAFRVRARRFPALVGCTVIDWFQPWPEEALLSVAKRFLGGEELGSDEVRDAVTRFMPNAFQTVNEASVHYLEQERRYNYTTPKSFLEMIKLFKSMLHKKRENLTQQIDRLQNGLTKLQTTAKDVAVLEEELKVKMVEVETKKAEAEAIATRVGNEKSVVEEESSKAAVTAEECARIAEEVTKKQEECAADLAKAEPAVAKAQEALNTLSKKDLTELKSLKTPPSGVDSITAAVLVLLSPPSGVAKDRSWQAAQKSMASVDRFMADLKDFKSVIDAEKVSPANFKAVRQYTNMPDFKGENVMNKSKAAAGLCEWVVNIVIYYDIVSEVEPKRRALAAAEQQLQDANTQKADAEAKVKELNEKLEVLIKEFDEVTAAKDAVIAEAERCQNKLSLAQRLVTALASENTRWAQGVDDLKAKLGVLVGDVLLSSAFVSYIGGFNNRFRNQLLREKWIPWMVNNKIPMSSTTNPDPLAILTNDAEMAVWATQGLPSDRVSVENGTILTNCARWPLMVDPQLQGIAWIKEREAKNDLKVVRLGQKKMLNELELALENGRPLLIENIGEKIDAVLYPVLGRNTFKKGRNLFVRLGDKEVEYHPNFRLILHTKLANPHYPPEIQAETTLINFTVTEDGLEDQLLARVVRKERPDLEEQKSALIQQQNEFKIKLKELEDDLLFRLSNAQGDILEDVELIENLEKTKLIATEIGEKVKVAIATEAQINEARESYRSVAARGSLIFFLMNSLVRVHTFYQYSLASFIVVFERAIDLAQQPADGNLKERLANVTESITYNVFNYVRRGLFEKHKLIVATQLCLKILVKAAALEAAEVEYLIYGKKHPTPPPMSEKLQEFLTENMWSGLCALKELPNFTKILEDIDGTGRVHWKKWIAEEKPERADLPGEYNQLTPFRKMLLVRALRADRMSGAIGDFVRATMGDRYVDSEQFDIKVVYPETGPAVPMFFTLFPGANYVLDVERLGKELEFTEENGRFVNISMGQGQEAIAEEALDKRMQEGGWVFLQNVHLMQRWLPTLERKLEAAAESGHADFRCFVSAEPLGDPLLPVVPQSILQSSVKITNEPPQDLKANLRRAFGNFNQEFLDRCSKKNEYRSCLFALCFFHALVLGRRKFGSQGWSRYYSFNTGDLTICADVLYNYLEANEQVPWEDIRYMFGEIMYGGHITDKWDRRTCSTYLKVLLRKELLAKMEMAPAFKSPDPGDYDFYKNYIETALPLESPVLFGLHPNAEINFLTLEGETLFKTILELQGASSGGGGASKEERVSEILEGLLARLPEDFNLIEINSRVEDKSPFVCVFLQECERMNILLSEIRRTLNELKLGLAGALNISEAMEALSTALFLDRVPAQWEKYAYPSLKRLGTWFNDLLRRVEQLSKWAVTQQLPVSVWIPGLFNPMSFLTAVMQVTARKTNQPLDRMSLLTDVTKLWPEKLEASNGQPPAEGVYVHGFFLEGAGLDLEEGCLRDSAMKELHPAVPVVHVTAVKVEDRPAKGIYECPVYLNSLRGFTYVFSATLKSNDPEHKWVLAGVALLMSDD